MEKVSIVLLTRQCTGNNIVEVTGECEKEYDMLSLYCLASEIIQKAKECGGKMIPYTGEPLVQKFCYAFQFETEEAKRNFLQKTC